MKITCLLCMLFGVSLLPRSLSAQTTLKRTVLTEYRVGTSPIHDITATKPLIPDAQRSTKKSLILAGILSLVVPGAGDVYAENYIMAGVFVLAEVAGWYFNVDYRRKGDDATGVYQEFADSHWSVAKYAEWLNEHAKKFPGGENAQPIDISSDPSLEPWERVNWEQLNAVEMLIPVFSHRLPAHGDQQYFEMIGKYDQYSYGWDDKLPANGSDGWSDYRQISERFTNYSGMRGRANSFYNTAGTFINLILLNHILSAVNAAWSAVRFNDYVDLHSGAQMQRTPGGIMEVVSTATFRIRL